MSRGRDLLLSLSLSAASIIVTLVLLEIVLRFFPVSTGLGSVAVNAQSPVFHFTPDRPYLHSMGWDMHNVVRGRINNAGFVNDQDYRRDDPRPLIAVVGDSFIEAQMVPFAETMQGRLARELGDKFRVYSFAAGGAPLSQYLIWARHAVREYGARAIVFNIIDNDFDESLSIYRFGPGFWLYAPDADGTLRLRLNEHRPGWLIGLVRRSALGRYLVINLQVSGLIFHVRALGEMIFGKPAPVAPPGKRPAPGPASPRVVNSLAALDAIFRDIPDIVGLPPENIMFTIDGFRYARDRDAARGSYFDVMRRALMEKAKEHGYEAIDLDDFFVPRATRTGERFEFPDDGHWSGIGHGVAAEAVLASKTLARLRQAGDKMTKGQ